MGLLEISLLTFVISAIISYYIWTRDKKWFKDFNGPNPVVPIFGNMYRFGGKEADAARFIHQALLDYKGVCRIWILNTPALWVSDSKIIKAILSSTVNIEKATLYEAIKPILGSNGLIASEGTQWRRDRKIFNPSFNKPFFDQTLRYVNAESKTVVEKLRDRTNKMIEPIQIFNECFLKVIVRSLSLSDAEIPKEHVEEYLYVLEKSEEIFHIKFFKPWLRYPLLWRLSGYKKIEDDLISRIRSKTRLVQGTAFNEKGKEHTISEDSEGDFTADKTHLLSETLFGTNESFIWKSHHFSSFMGAAMDTTALALQSTLFFLALNPECQKKAADEIKSVVGDADEVTHDHLSQLKYLEMCWKEAMRLHPPVPVVGRKVVEDVTLEDGRTILKGTDVMIIQREAHRNPDSFEDPEKYDPERFSPERLSQIKPYSYIPFSLGVRNCIGMKMGTLESKVTLVYVIRDFEVSTCQRQEDIEITYVVAGKPLPAIKLSFAPRNNN